MGSGGIENKMNKDKNNPFICDGSSYSGKLTKEEQAKILTNFVEKISNQKNMPPKYQMFVSENFWDLVQESPELIATQKERDNYFLEPFSMGKK